MARVQASEPLSLVQRASHWTTVSSPWQQVDGGPDRDPAPDPNRDFDVDLDPDHDPDLASGLVVAATTVEMMWNTTHGADSVGSELVGVVGRLTLVTPR